MSTTDSALIKFWDDAVVDTNPDRLKKAIPKLPKVTNDFQTVTGAGAEKLAYLAWQIVKTTDKLVIMRAMASACSILLNDSKNFTGSPTVTEVLTGLDVASDERTPPEQVLRTNFRDAEDVTVEELLTLMAADSDEVGAYFGVLFLAGNKRVTDENRSAFNDRRAASATASIIGAAQIFVTDSPYLDDTVLAKVYAAFLSFSPLRANMTSRVVHHLGDSHMGPALAFTSMFLLLVDNGMSAMRMIKEAVIKHPWIRSNFAELRPELNAANEAQNIIRNAAPAERSFLKAIHGNAFVPVNYNDIDNLVGVCKEVLKRSTPSYQNYGGGKVSEGQMAIINQMYESGPLVVPEVASE